jgi:mono/diheme cytochrome c family protein
MSARWLIILGSVAALALLAGGALAIVGVRHLQAKRITADPPADTVEPAVGQVPAAKTGGAAPAKADEFAKRFKPFAEKYCNNCHNSNDSAGSVSLDAYLNESHARKDRKTFETVAEVLATGTMPPKKNKAQPTRAERDDIIAYVNDTLTKTDCTAARDPGRVTLRRLNKAEYNNTIRDLCGVDFQPAADFPSDEVGYGFDHIGDVLSMQPIMVEKYMNAAEKILDAAIPPMDRVQSSKQSFRQQAIQAQPRESKSKDPVRINFTKEGFGYVEKFNFPAEGDYIVRFRATGSKVGGAAAKAEIRIDGKAVKDFVVDVPGDKPTAFETKTRMKMGEFRVAVAFTNPFEDKKEPDPAKRFRTLGLHQIEIEGPIGGVDRPIPPGAQRLIVAKPGPGVTPAAAAEKILAAFARKAYRRPVKPAELERMVKLYKLAEGRGEPFEKAIRLPMKAVLVSPHFLFRIEDDPKDADGIRTINDWEFATRLSYFLWSTMPDEELFSHADKGTLRKPEVLKAQVARMLKDPRSKALTENFAQQWLTLRQLKTMAPDAKTFPNWDESLRSAMLKETESYFDYVVKNDRRITEFLDSDYTFLNERLARHYGIPGVQGNDFRYVKLSDRHRGGILTQASVLTVTSNPTRTSPVKRGKWVLENILGTPPPPPAPDVPELEATPLKGTLRQQMEQHRANPACATCHAKLDPMGFGLENFDAIGAWRTEEKKTRIDASGEMPDGSKFNGPAELRKMLLGKSEAFRKCFAEKMLTYALGRGLEYYDHCVLDDLVKSLKSGDDKLSALVMAVVQSDPFQKRKGKRSE